MINDRLVIVTIVWILHIRLSQAKLNLKGNKSTNIKLKLDYTMQTVGVNK